MPMPRRQCVESERICATTPPRLTQALNSERPCSPNVPPQVCRIHNTSTCDAQPTPCSVPLPCQHRYPGPTCYSGNSCLPSEPECTHQPLVTQKRSKFKYFKKKGAKKSNASQLCHRPCPSGQGGNSSQSGLQQDSDESLPCYDPSQGVCPAEIVPLCLNKSKRKRAAAPCSLKAQTIPCYDLDEDICPAEKVPLCLKKKKSKHTTCSATPAPCYDIPCQTGSSCTSIKSAKRSSKSRSNVSSRLICAIPPKTSSCAAKPARRSVSFDCGLLRKGYSCRPVESPCGKQAPCFEIPCQTSQTSIENKKTKKSRKDQNVSTLDKLYCECSTSTSSSNLKSEKNKSEKKRWKKEAATSYASHSATQSETSLRSSHSQTGVVALACPCDESVNQSMSGDGMCQKSLYACMCSEDDASEKPKDVIDASCACTLGEAVSEKLSAAVVTSEVGFNVNSSVCEPPGERQCDCHFPPAFNQITCTGNISGSCNCDRKTVKKKI